MAPPAPDHEGANAAPTEQDGRVALRDHLMDKALQARLRAGLLIDADAIIALLDDPALVRYPVSLRFDAEPLVAGEFAFPAPLGDRPADGFCLCIHPHFERQPDAWPLLIAYHIPSINYGDIVSAGDAEVFGATLLGMTIDEYYHAVCALADGLVARQGAAP